MLYREDLDKMTCQQPGCKHEDHDAGLFLHGRCHFESPTWCEYSNGKLTVTCAKCKQPIAIVAVAQREQP